MNIQQHPDPRQLIAFACGYADAEAAIQLEQHVASCDECCRAVAQVKDDRLIELARAAVETLGPISDTEVGDTDADQNNSATSKNDLEFEPPVELRNHARYQVLEPLGQGGMGMVFKAEHRLMKRIVALKVINRRLTENETALARFRQEVEAAASLSHPNIVTAHDAEQAGDMHFLVMEFVEGTSLDQLVKNSGGLSIDRACDFIRQAAMGLQHVHERGMVHRDIKPQNLIVTKEATVKVLDFGLARLASELSIGADKLTKEHTVLGTPDFISPEQAEDSRTVDARSDIYSLGCTLYYLLAARVPFPVASSMLKLSSHLLVEPKPISSLRGDVPSRLVVILERMMAKDPAQRFQTTQEVIAALTPFVPSGPTEQVSESVIPAVAPARRLPTHLRRRALLLATTLLVLPFAGVFFAWHFWTQQQLETGRGAVAEGNQPQVLFLLAPDELWFEDYGPVHVLLEERGVIVTVASSRRNITLHPDGGGEGVEVTADLLLDQLETRQFDIIVLCGGQVTSFCDESASAKRVRAILRHHLDMNKFVFVAAICGGQEILARAGLLQGVECAKPVSSDEWGQEGQVIWNVQDPVVRSGQIVTASDPDDAEEFALELLRLLGKT